MRGALSLAVLIGAAAGQEEEYDAEGDTGRDLLFSNPAASLPDVLISESVKYGTEGDSFYYNVALTHAPGMREDETIDLMNDEVRIYLTSSQEVYQEDDPGGAKGFQQRVGHRTQMVIDTGVTVDFSGSSPVEGSARAASELEGPTPYKYVAYSTVNPTQAAPFQGSGLTATYQVVCPVCAHSAYCTMTTDVIPGTVFGPSHHVPADTTSTSWLPNGADFDGCYQIEYKGYAPVYDECAAGPVVGEANLVYVGNSWTRPAGIFTPATCVIGADTFHISEEIAVAKQQCTGFTEYSFVHTPAVGTCIDDTSGDDVTSGITDTYDGTPVSGVSGTADAAGNVEGLVDDCGTGVTWTETTASSDDCIDEFGTTVWASDFGETDVLCEGVDSTNTWTDAYCTITIMDKDGAATAVPYDGDDVRGNAGVQSTLGPIDRKLCMAAAASPQIILPSPGLKSARQYTAATNKPVTKSPSSINTGHLMPEQEKGMTSHAPCRPLVAAFDGVTGIITRVAMGGEDPFWLTHRECWDKVSGKYLDCAGNLKAVAEPCAASATSCDPTALATDAAISDFRIRADGSPVLRDIPRIDDYCRYCDRPGLLCDDWTSTTEATLTSSPVAASTSVTLLAANPAIYPGQVVTGNGLTSESEAVTVAMITGTDLVLSSVQTLGASTVLTFTKTDTDILAAPTNSDGNTLSQNNDGCIKDTVNGGDIAPNTENWLLESYNRGAAGVGGPSWRGDLSSGAQLVFDSTNYATPQAVKVTIRDDHIYEPTVFGRGQDAYIHHYVVAEDKNLQHTYYEDIDVNDLVVSITDNDPALVLQDSNSVAPTEGTTFHDGSTPTITLRLASEPLYDVTVYFQSGPFFDAAAPSAATNFMPDDEQVIYQDAGQYAVCFDTETGLRSVSSSDHSNLCGTDAHMMRSDGNPYDRNSDRRAFPTASFARAGGVSNLNSRRDALDTAVAAHTCDPNGLYVRPESYKDSQDDAGGSDDPFGLTLGNTGTTSYHLPTAWACTGFNTETECEADAAIAAGCEWEVEEYEWVPCSCVGTITPGGAIAGAWPHGLAFPNAAGARDGTVYEVCLDRELTAQLTTLGVIDGTASGDVPGALDAAVQTGTVAHIYETFCENYGTKFDDESGTITAAFYATADPGACLEGCRTWESGVCYDTDGTVIGTEVTRPRSEQACVKTGNRYISGSQTTPCVVTADGIPVTGGPSPPTPHVMDQVTCTGATGHHWTAASTTDARCIDPSGNIIALEDTDADASTYCAGADDGCLCTYGAAVWKAVDCTYTSGTDDPVHVTTTSTVSRVDPGTEEGCEGKATGRTWDGTACNDPAGLATGKFFATEQACTGLSTYNDGVIDHVFSWRGTASATKEGTADAAIVGLCKEPLGYETGSDGALISPLTPKQGGNAIDVAADGATLSTEADCVATGGVTGAATADAGFWLNGNQYFHGAGTCRIADNDFGKAVALACDPLQGLVDTDCETASPTTPCSKECLGCTFDSDGVTDTLNTWIDASGFCKSGDGATQAQFGGVDATKVLCQNNYDALDSGSPRAETRGSCVNSYTNSKSMDMVCGTWPTGTCNDQEGCIWSATAGACIADDLGYDCNSFLVFTSTNWNTFQTVKVIAVEDDEDETDAKPTGTDTSEVGYLYTSRDWYYNSPGSSLLADSDSAYVPSAAPWSETVDDNSGEPSVSTDSQAALSDLSMFDTRFGTHINRYPWTLGDANIPSGVVDCSSATAALEAEDHPRTEDGTSSWATVSQHWRKSVIDQSGHVIEPAGFMDEPHHNCALVAPHTVDALNQVCVDMDSTATVDGPPEQVTTFDPTMYVVQDTGALCGATTNVVDSNLRTVEISRYQCDATEGRRYYYKDFNNQVNPTEFEWMGLYGHSRGTVGHIRGLQRTERPQKLPTALGLFDQAGSIQAAATDGPADLWTTSNVLASEIAEYGMSSSKKMSMPTCPFTIVLTTAPQEGTTVVVAVFEDPIISAYRDNELYFYEEPTFRPGVGGDCQTSGTASDDCAECDTHYPGSVWLSAHDGGSCFIQNVDYDAGEAIKFHPRGGKTLDVMFTDQDWDVPRRITIIALNDDVDEPAETRVVYFDTKPCVGTNHNNAATCMHDPLYDDALITTPTDGSTTRDTITVTVIDDDIADLVVLCGDNAGGTPSVDAGATPFFRDTCAILTVDGTGSGECQEAGSGCIWAGDSGCIFDYEDDEVFIGSYDDSHPHNRWHEEAERRGADAEDGMSYSLFGGGISTYYDGIGGGASAAVAVGRSEPAARIAGERCKNCGYVSIVETIVGSKNSDEGAMTRNRCITRVTTADTLSTLTETLGTTSSNSATSDLGGDQEGCYPDTTVGAGDLIYYDPYSDRYCDALDTQAVLTGGTFAAFDFTASAENLIVSVDSGATITLALALNCDTAANCATIITDAITAAGATGLTVAEDSGVLTITSDSQAISVSSIEIAAYSGTNAKALFGTVRAKRKPGPHCAGTGTNGFRGTAANGAYFAASDHVRGFKGVGPAVTEPDAHDQYVCTIHSRECKDLGSDGNMKDSEHAACEYGEFKVRLNSSPGTKKVTRQYVGVTNTVQEEELVTIVITPDETPQTRFEPTSVTFTHTGGIVDGKDTYRWDEPVVIEVIPVDDAVDERAGVIVDFTAFTVTQSHKFDEYWTYTTPYMDMTVTTADVDTGGSSGDTAVTLAASNAAIRVGQIVTGTGISGTPVVKSYDGAVALVLSSDQTIADATTLSFGRYAANDAEPNVGVKCVIDPAGSTAADLFGTAANCVEGSAGRIHAHTPYRHTIRTIHTMDNDYSGVRIESSNTDTTWSNVDTKAYDATKSVAEQTVDSSNGNYYTHIPVGLQATEGDTFTFYTIQLDTQPRKIQRQTGTHPNNAIVFNQASDDCYDQGDSSDGYDGPSMANNDFFNDWTDASRPYACGSVEVETNYWVDVTATATIHVDLATPPTCPAAADTPWGGGLTGATPSGGRHPRFPFNAIDRGSGFVPFDELIDSPGDMTGYLSTCGDWQRDATYRFTAENWNVPQYVYVYAHNDKDSHDLYNAAFGISPPTGDVTTHPDHQGGDAHVRHGGNENVDSSVGLDPEPWTDGDGRAEADHGDNFITADVSGAVTAADAVTLALANAAIQVGQLVSGAGITGTPVVKSYDGAVALVLSSAQTIADAAVLTFGAGNSRPTYTDMTGVAAAEAYTTTIRHYVETEDTLDNMQTARFVQWNKFGGLYTVGNPERFPFGYDRVTGQPGYAKLDETGFTTWGYTQYESLYGYGYFNDGAWSTAGCCSTTMGGNWGTTTGGTTLWGTGGGSDTEKGQGGTDSNELGAEFINEGTETCRFHLTGRDEAATAASNYETWSGRFFHTPPGSSSGVATAANVGPACVDHISGNALPRPYYQASPLEVASGVVVPTGYPCTPVVAGQFCTPRFATSYKTNSDNERQFGHRDSTDRTTGHGMKFPPQPVYIAIKDNDRQRDQTIDEMKDVHASCRQTRLFQFADKTGSDSEGSMTGWDAASTPGTSKTGVLRTEWLVDYNCPTSGAVRSDAGALPGFPVSTVTPGAAGVMAPTDLTPNLRFDADGSCTDDATFTDYNSETCSYWVGYNCYTYSGPDATQRAAIVAACCLTCHPESPANAPTSCPSVTATVNGATSSVTTVTLHAANSAITGGVYVTGGGIASDVTVASISDTALVLSASSSVTDNAVLTFTDSSTYTDANGDACSAWVGYNCYSSGTLTDAERLDLTNNCCHTCLDGFVGSGTGYLPSGGFAARGVASASCADSPIGWADGVGQLLQRGAVTGDSAMGANDFGGGAEDLVISVDGGATVTLSLTFNCDTVANCVIGINAAIDAATGVGASAAADYTGAKMVLRSDSSGSASSLAIDASSGTAVKALFGTAVTSPVVTALAHTCADYESSSYCDRFAAGGTGSGWDADWGTMASQASGGKDASEACCFCGGGIAVAPGGAHITPGDPVDYADVSGGTTGR